MTNLELMNLLALYRLWILRQEHYRVLVDQACGYDEELEEANARVEELEAQLLERLRRDENEATLIKASND